MKLLFATGSKRKLAEANASCEPAGIEIQQIDLDIVEIQSHDPHEITENKINEAFRLSGKPVVITDTSWNIPSLNGFPGGYMKDVSKWFKPSDFIALMKNKTDRRIAMTETIAYKDANRTKYFSKEYWGEIANVAAGSGESIEVVAKFDGKTIGQKRDAGQLGHDPKDYIWHDFAKWFASSLD